MGDTSEKAAQIGKVGPIHVGTGESACMAARQSQPQFRPLITPDEGDRPNKIRKLKLLLLPIQQPR